MSISIFAFKVFLVLLSFCLVAMCSFAQTELAIKSDSATKSQAISPAKFVVPAGMLMIGVAALDNSLLQNMNKGVRRMVLNSNDNFDNTYEDHLRFAPAAVTFLMPALGIKGKSSMIDKVMLFTISTAIMDQAVGRLKKSGNFMRPDGSNNRSFPSGHTTTAFAAAEFMRQEYKDTSPWLAVGAYTAATATGVLRVYHNKHWLTDVVAGAGLGILSTDLAYYIYPKLKSIVRRKRNNNDELSVSPAYIANTPGLTITLKLN